MDDVTKSLFTGAIGFVVGVSAQKLSERRSLVKLVVDRYIETAKKIYDHSHIFFLVLAYRIC